jgi:plasmid stability protein
VKNITVSVPDEVYRQARILAAERNTSVSALVREFLVQVGEQREGQKEPLRETIDSIRKAHPDFSAADRLSRDQVHDRDALRREHDSALRDKSESHRAGLKPRAG